MLASLLALALSAPTWGTGQDLPLTTLDGRTVQLSSVAAKVTVVSIWGTFCGPCLQELPELEKLHERYRDDREVAILAVSIDPGQTAEDRANVQRMAEKLGLKMPVLIDHGPVLSKLAASVDNQFGVPSLFVIDDRFNVYRELGFSPEHAASFVEDHARLIELARHDALPPSPVAAAASEAPTSARVPFDHAFSPSEWAKKEPEQRRWLERTFAGVPTPALEKMLAQLRSAALAGTEAHLVVPPELAKALDAAHRADALAQKDASGALELYRQAYAGGAHSSGLEYNAACVAVRAGNRDEAFTWLDRASADGWDDADWAAKDKDLAPIRTDPRFPKALAQMKQRHELALTKEGARDPKLQHELLELAKVDQEVREAMVKAGPGRHPELAAQMSAVDRKNTARLEAIVAAHGWPGRTLVGESAAHAAWLLVQHADLDVPFQEKCLPLLEAAVKQGDASGQELAYLTDRVLLAQGKPQRYGTQFAPENGKLVPRPIEDAAHVDERRRAIGLVPLDDYRKQMERAYLP